MDQITSLTLDYLSILKERLYIEWDDNGNPVADYPKINQFSYQRIRSEIRQLFDGETLLSAITASRDYGSKRFQNLGFGLVNDFDTFVRLGFMCGERVVLWDFLWGQMLSDPQPTDSYKNLVLSIAFDLVRLIPVALEGGISILPHPMLWAEPVRRQLTELAKTPYYTATNQGLVTALAVQNELMVNPYTLFPGKIWPEHPTDLINHRGFTQSDYLFHKAATSFLEDVRFAYLKDIPISEFYKIFVSRNNGNGSFYDQFRDRLGSSLENLSIPQLSLRHEKLKRDLAEDIESRNKQIALSSFVKAGAGITFVSSMITLIDHFALQESRSALTAALLAAGGSLLSILAEALQKQKSSIVVNAFCEAKTYVPGVVPGL